MNNIIFYITLALFAVSFAYIIRPNGTLIKYLSKNEKEVEMLKKVSKFTLGLELYDESYVALCKKGTDEEKTIINNHNVKYETNFTNIEDTVVDSVLRRVNFNGVIYIITIEQAREAIKALLFIIEYETKK